MCQRFGLKNSQILKAIRSTHNYEKSQTDKVDYTKKVKDDFVCFGFRGICKSKFNNNNN